MNIDPITFEVMKNVFVSISEEMRGVVRRSSFSPNIYERGDCSCVIYDPQGESLIEMGHLPLHLGITSIAMKNVLKEIGDDLYEGDMIVTNDPYMGTSHLPDVILFAPVYYKEKHFGFVGNLAHHNDVGGMRPGSMSADATEVIQEGIRFPCVKICNRGEINKDIVKILIANTRTPRIEEGDIYAQINGNQLGIKRMRETISKYGAETVLEFMESIKDYSERRMIQEIKNMTEGTFEAVDYVDLKDPPYKIKVKVMVSSNTIKVDFRGSDEQTRTCYNIPWATLVSAVQCVIRSITDPTIPYNSGIFRRVKIIAPEGSIVNCKFPAAVSGASELACKVVEAMFHALHAALVGKVAAGSAGTGENFRVGGINPKTNKPYVYGEPSAGGYGAGPTNDGENAFNVPISNIEDTPVESMEIGFPVMVDRYELIPDSGGAGKFRGGLGLRRDLRILDQDAMLSVQGGRISVRPYSLQGGRPGSTGKHVLNPGTGSERLLEPLEVLSLSNGDVFSIRTPGGGGYGNPLDRDVEKVRKDVLDGYISLESAEKDYGVILSPKTNQVDLKRTELQRRKLRGQKG